MSGGKASLPRNYFLVTKSVTGTLTGHATYEKVVLNFIFYKYFLERNSLFLKFTSDDICSLLCQHDGGGVEVTADDAGHDAGVHYPQTVHTKHLEIGDFGNCGESSRG